MQRSLEAIVGVGAVPYIPFKVNTTGEGPDLWRRLYHFYENNQPEFLAHYHQRSNAEMPFSMTKARFGDRSPSKTDAAQVNEALCKVLAHNFCCLVQSIYKLEIVPMFWKDAQRTFRAESLVARKRALA